MQQRVLSTQTRFMDRAVVRYGIAIIAAGAALLLRLPLSYVLGSRVTFITFFPAIMVAALLGGFGPGLLTTILSALFNLIWIVPRAGQLRVTNPTDVALLVSYTVIGIFMSAVAEFYRRARDKSAETETALYETEKEFEAHRLEFYTRTILAATGDKLVVTEPAAIRDLPGEQLKKWKFNTVTELTPIREAMTRLVDGLGITVSTRHRLMCCVGEMTSNAIKHAGGGTATLYQDRMDCA